jgi:23S rRNA pseudouridine955/2504/2580 synthase
VTDAVTVLHRDPHFLVVAKPAGLATTAPDGGPCLVSAVQALDPEAPQLHPLSRLDTQVTGLVCFARTAQGNHMALAARRAGSFRRRYLGLTVRPVAPSSGVWEWAIALDPRDPKKRRALDPHAHLPPGAKAARTEYRLREVAGAVTALDLFPITGRTHQLRVHASAAGCALFGDVAYGADKRCVLANGRVLSAQRVMLHCAHVRLPRGRGADLELWLDAPDDMARLYAAAGGEPGRLNEARSG